MDEPVVLQSGPETFQVLRSGHGRIEVTLAHHTRRGLGMHGVPPVQVVTEIVHFLLERDGWPADEPEPVALAAVAARYPEFVEEIRSRLG